MKYAIVRLGGQQYKISEGDVLRVNRTKSPETRVMAFFDTDSSLLGKPYLDNVSVDLEVEKDEKGKKITVRRFKAKSRYHKTRGFRPLHSILRVKGIRLNEDQKTPRTSKQKVKKVE